MAANPTVSSIWHRDASGAVDFHYSANHPFYRVVERCTKICRRMLEHPDAQRAFVTLAEEFKNYKSPGAPPSYEINSKDTGDMEKYTKDFFENIFTRFPTMIVDFTLLEANFMACHDRRELDTAIHPRLQWISFNGQRVSNMADAADKATTQATANNQLQYNRFLFMYSNALLHELAQIYVTYLSLGRSKTPDKINEGKLARLRSGFEAESGYWLEKALFGGVVNEYRDPIVGTEQHMSGVPHLCREDGIFRIDQETIDKVANCQIEFPYRYSGPKERRKLLNMDSNNKGPKSDPNKRNGPIEALLASHIVSPPPNINFDVLWHPAPRSGPAAP